MGRLVQVLVRSLRLGQWTQLIGLSSGQELTRLPFKMGEVMERRLRKMWRTGPCSRWWRSWWGEEGGTPPPSSTSLSPSTSPINLGLSPSFYGQCLHICRYPECFCRQSTASPLAFIEQVIAVANEGFENRSIDSDYSFQWKMLSEILNLFSGIRWNKSNFD